MTQPAGSLRVPTLAGLGADPNMRFPKRPRLINDLRVFEMPDGLGLQLHFGDTPVVLRGQLVGDCFSFLQRHLDGNRDIDQLAAAIPAELPEASVARTLRLLHTKGLLVDGAVGKGSNLSSDPVLGRQLLFWGRHVGNTRAADNEEVIARRLAHASVILIATGLFGAASADLLARSGCNGLKVMAWDDDGPVTEGTDFLEAAAMAGPASLASVERFVREWLFEADLVVTATRNAPDALFEVINRLCLNAEKPWLRGNLDASSLELGPYVHPHSSACFACLRLRRRSADPLAIERELDHGARSRSESRDGIPPVGEALFAATLGASYLTGEVIRVVTGVAMPALLNRVLTVHPLTGEQHDNRVLRVPRCPECSRASVVLADRVRA